MTINDELDLMCWLLTRFDGYIIGSFKYLKLLVHLTLQCVNEFSRDPLLLAGPDSSFQSFFPFLMMLRCHFDCSNRSDQVFFLC